MLVQLKLERTESKKFETSSAQLESETMMTQLESIRVSREMECEAWPVSGREISPYLGRHLEKLGDISCSRFSKKKGTIIYNLYIKEHRL